MQYWDYNAGAYSLAPSGVENTLPAHNRTDTTLVVGNEDEEFGQLWIYAGTKQSAGSRTVRTASSRSSTRASSTPTT